MAFANNGLNYSSGQGSDSEWDSYGGYDSEVEDLRVLQELLPDRDPRDIGRAIAELKYVPHRRERVGLSLIEPKDQAMEEEVNPNLAENDDIVKYVQQVLDALPNVDLNIVYATLERGQSRGHSLEKTKRNIIRKAINPTAKPHTSVNFKIKPKNKRNCLRPHNHADNHPQPAERDTDAQKMEHKNNMNVMSDDTLKGFGIHTPLNDEQKDRLYTVMQIFPEVDPLWVVRMLEEGPVAELVQRMFAQPGSYDRLRTRQGKELIERRRNDMLDRNQFNPAHFIQLYPLPQTHFTQQNEVKSFLYVDHATTALQNDFRMLRVDFLKKILTKHSQRLYPAYKEAKQFVDKTRDVTRSPFVKKPRDLSKWPDNIDEAFFKELQYARWEDDIIQYETDIRTARAKKVAEAHLYGTLLECACCLIADCLPEDMVICDSEHDFCKSCVVQVVENKLAEGHHNIECLSGDCEQTYKASSLRHILQATTFNRLVRNMQQQELREANVDHLESCPFCDFAMVIDNPNEKLFTCLNPECLKVSCRECKDLDHLPLRCDEVEKGDDVKMRTYIEEKCAEALIRKCPTCQKPIIKESGCNKMACPCGTYFCYVCNDRLDKANPYGHFKDGTAGGGGIINSHIYKRDKCKMFTSTQELHHQAALKAGQEARQMYLDDHPQMVTRGPDANMIKKLAGLPANQVKSKRLRRIRVVHHRDVPRLRRVYRPRREDNTRGRPADDRQVQPHVLGRWRQPLVVGERAKLAEVEHIQRQRQNYVIGRTGQQGFNHRENTPRQRNVIGNVNPHNTHFMTPFQQIFAQQHPLVQVQGTDGMFTFPPRYHQPLVHGRADINDHDMNLPHEANVPVNVNEQVMMHDENNAISQSDSSASVGYGSLHDQIHSIESLVDVRSSSPHSVTPSLSVHSSDSDTSEI